MTRYDEKIKLECQGLLISVKWSIQIRMAGGDSVAIYTRSSTCFMLHLEFHVWMIVQIKAEAFMRAVLIVRGWPL